MEERRALGRDRVGTLSRAVAVGLVLWGLGLGSPASAFQLIGSNWTYMPHPMGEDLVICPAGMPAGAVERIMDGAAVWNYEHFQFTFGPVACLSQGKYPLLNHVNQIDFGPLPPVLLAQTTVFFFSNAPTQAVECDTRFTTAVPWYTGTATPGPTEFDWWSVAAHELGHCLGLDEEPHVLPPPVEYPTLAPGTVRRELTADDLAGREAIYGPAGGAPGPSSSGGQPARPGGGGGCSLTPGGHAAPAGLTLVGHLDLLGVLLVLLGVWARRR